MSSTHIELLTTCTRDEAIASMLGIKVYSRLVPRENASDEEIEACESWSFNLREYLEEKIEHAESSYCEAKFDHAPADEIAEKQASCTRIKEIAQLAEVFARQFDDEIAKGVSSEIRSLNGGYTLDSVERWRVRVENTQPAPARQKPISKQRQQEEAILNEIRRLEKVPTQLPKRKPGECTIKLDVRTHLANTELFTGKTVFEKAWERLRNDGRLAESS